MSRVVRPQGTVEYTTTDGLVTAIVHNGKKVRAFAYTTRGQLQSAWSADGTTVAYARVCPTFYTWRLEQGYTAYNARREVKFAPAPSWGNVHLSKTKSIG